MIGNPSLIPLNYTLLTQETKCIIGIVQIKKTKQYTALLSCHSNQFS